MKWFTMPPRLIHTLRWYALMVTVFALSWSWAWSIDVVMWALIIAVAGQFIALLLDPQ
jgi:hypothetical protein